LWYAAHTVRPLRLMDSPNGALSAGTLRIEISGHRSLSGLYGHDTLLPGLPGFSCQAQACCLPLEVQSLSSPIPLAESGSGTSCLGLRHGGVHEHNRFNFAILARRNRLSHHGHQSSRVSLAHALHRPFNLSRTDSRALLLSGFLEAECLC
jgi:hypothetical protein